LELQYPWLQYPVGTVYTRERVRGAIGIERSESREAAAELQHPRALRCHAVLFTREREAEDWRLGL
jgi:hypothetical protein